MQRTLYNPNVTAAWTGAIEGTGEGEAVKYFATLHGILSRHLSPILAFYAQACGLSCLVTEVIYRRMCTAEKGPG